MTQHNTAIDHCHAQNQKAVTAYFWSQLLLRFDFTLHSKTDSILSVSGYCIFILHRTQKLTPFSQHDQGQVVHYWPKYL